ncbi:hypothetical protein [Methylobacterium sp. B1]|uniref:hypothetical protein n=1 Tax=Methylobacterium sp. B1 TaxID=91459 RepID=UPI00034D4D3F|nr:hypothetical protein [Methylobacterium sp. B1]
MARSGTGTLVALFDRLQPRPSGRYGSLPVSAWDMPTAFGVRAALAAAPETEYAAALEAALRLAAAEPEPTLARRTVLTLFALPVTPTSKYSAAMVHRMQEYGHTQNRV